MAFNMREGWVSTYIHKDIHKNMAMEQKFPLSKQESRILNSLSRGRLYKEIASDYSISINTVKKHCKNIYRKLDVHSRAQAKNLFLQSDLQPATN